MTSDNGGNGRGKGGGGNGVVKTGSGVDCSPGAYMVQSGAGKCSQLKYSTAK